jgi:hypothetical protein
MQMDFGFEGNGATWQRGGAGKGALLTRLVQQEAEWRQRKQEQERAQDEPWWRGTRCNNGGGGVQLTGVVRWLIGMAGWGGEGA